MGEGVLGGRVIMLAGDALTDAIGDAILRSAEVTDVGATGKNCSRSAADAWACVRDLRITVADVLGLLSAGQSRASILDDSAYLEDADIDAVLA